MLVNDGLKHFVGKSDFPYCLIVNIELENVQNHGLPTDEEAEVLNSLEDTLVEELSKVTIPLQIGRETYYEEREILIYFPVLPNFKTVVNSISKKLNQSRSVKIELYNDPKWIQASRYLGDSNDA